MSIEYDKSDAINFSKMKFMADCPLEYQYRQEVPIKRTPAILKGLAIHCAIYQPDLFPRDYAAKSDESSGDQAMVLSDNDYADVIAIRDKYQNLYGVSDPKQSEKEIFWVNRETGLPCKARLDYVLESGFEELKTVSSAYINAAKFGWQCLRMQYDVQLAFYHDGLEENGMIADPVHLDVIQQIAPYDIVRYEVPHYVIEDGRAKYLKHLYQIKECMENDYWPGRSGKDRLTLVLPQRFNDLEDDDFESPQ